MTAPTPQAELTDGLTRIHLALRRSLETIVRVSGQPIPARDRGDFAEFCARFARFLHIHHDGEEEIVFPKLTEAAGRASLPAFADNVTTWRADHKTLLGTLSAFEAAGAELGKGGPQEPLHQAAGGLREILFPHLDAEEAALDGPAFGKLLQADEILALSKASAEHGQRVGGPAMLVMLVHALSADEQRAQFSELPWIVRKLLLKRIWARNFRGCLKYAHNPSVAL
jgi:hypothetical protein